MKEVMIQTELLCKSFVTDGQANHVIKNLNLEIYRGDFTVVMGSSGSGKSTLLYLLSGMDDVTSGKVYFDGQCMSSYKEKEMMALRRHQLGFVFQSIHLIPDLTVFENVLSPSYKLKIPKRALLERANTLLEQMGLEAHKNKFEGQLSGGQKQKVAICRALMNKPDVVFADEPTGALNSSQGENVLDIFTELYEAGQTVVMVTHDLKAALRGNRIIYLKDGRIDGILDLEPFSKQGEKERENSVYTFLKERGW